MRTSSNELYATAALLCQIRAEIPINESKETDQQEWRKLVPMGTPTSGINSLSPHFTYMLSMRMSIISHYSSLVNVGWHLLSYDLTYATWYPFKWDNYSDSPVVHGVDMSDEWQSWTYTLVTTSLVWDKACHIESAYSDHPERHHWHDMALCFNTILCSPKEMRGKRLTRMYC